MKSKIVLASASPRRRELLKMIGVADFEIMPASSEADYPVSMRPDDAVKYISMCKAESVAPAAGENSLVIAADTVVCLDGRILEKPSGPEDAKRMLGELSGRRHTVYTGIALIRGAERISDCAATDVWFKELSGREIDAYVESGQPLDKAGAYGAQDMAALFVRRVDGEFWNVVGLPVCRLGQLLAELGEEVP
ncbi:MAG: septum formation protein Maf [Oscillospiraceae bacterium]|nr:septum formation protein Maf [Oscillospiraceae bacterium]